MNTRTRSTLPAPVLPAAVLVLLFAIASFAGDAPAFAASPLGLPEVLAWMTQMDDIRMQSLREYSSVRRYTLENSRFGTSAEMRVRMLFQPTGTKKFEVLSERGSSLIRKSVLQRLMKTEQEATSPELRAATRITAENYKFNLLGIQPQNGRVCYVLDAEPKAPTKYHFRGRVWVDAEDFAIARIEGEPAVNPSFWIRKTAFVHTYGRFGSYWLPLSNHSENDVRIYGRTTVKVDYGDYQIKETGAGAGPRPGKSRDGGGED